MSDQSNYVMEWRRRVKIRLIEYKGGKCEKCGYNKKIPATYDFHHKDASQKDFGIATKGHCRNIESLKQEVDKCLLVCRNCHAEIHHTRPNAKEEWDAALKPFESKLKIIQCPCGEMFSQKATNQKYCSYKCAQFDRRKIKDRPDKETLTQLLSQHSMLKISKMYGVSDHTIRKWRDAYKI
jgi:hypothetical protein